MYGTHCYPARTSRGQLTPCPCLQTVAGHFEPSSPIREELQRFKAPAIAKRRRIDRREWKGSRLRRVAWRQPGWAIQQIHRSKFGTT